MPLCWNLDHLAELSQHSSNYIVTNSHFENHSKTEENVKEKNQHCKKQTFPVFLTLFNVFEVLLLVFSFNLFTVSLQDKIDLSLGEK